nr:DUF411 domain-containing protein [Janibacter limosus]
MGVTALNPDGDVFVGHVPARFVLEYLADPPKGARGLSVPAMPVGTPGMEQGDQFDPYDVLLLTDGKPRVLAKVTKAFAPTGLTPISPLRGSFISSPVRPGKAREHSQSSVTASL